MADETEMIGARMRELREGMPGSVSQRECAEKLPGNVQASEWSRWERGKHRPTDLDAVAAALDTSAADLVAGPLSARHTPEEGDLMGALNGSTGSADAAKVFEKLDQLLDQQTELLADVSEVHSEQEAQRKILERVGRGRAAKGK